MNCILILSHGNADLEGGFSVNEHLLNIHGSFTNEETIEALRFVIDCLNRKGGIESIKVIKDLIKVCQNTHFLYRQGLQKIESRN